MWSEAEKDTSLEYSHICYQIWHIFRLFKPCDGKNGGGGEYNILSIGAPLNLYFLIFPNGQVKDLKKNLPRKMGSSTGMYRSRNATLFWNTHFSHFSVISLGLLDHIFVRILRPYDMSFSAPLPKFL